MRNNVVTSLLLGLMAVSVLATAGLALYYVRCVRNLNHLQYQAAAINRNRSLLTSLANDTVEYSKRNPAIDPILQSVGVKPKPAAPPAPAPAKP